MGGKHILVLRRQPAVARLPHDMESVVPAEAAGINLSKHTEVPQGGLNGCFHLWRDLRRLHALR